MLLTGVCFAQDFEKVHAQHILVKHQQRQFRLKKQLMTAEILNIMQKHILFVRQVKTAVILGTSAAVKW